MKLSSSHRDRCAPVCRFGSYLALTVALTGGVASAQDYDWVAPSGNFCDNWNWIPNTVPTMFDNAFLGRAGAITPNVTLDCSRDMMNLTMLQGARLFTSGNQLLVYDTLAIHESGGWQAFLTVNPFSDPTVPALLASDIDLQGGAVLNLSGGIAGCETLTIDGASRLGGFGELYFNQPGNKSVLVLDGSIRPGGSAEMTIRNDGAGWFDLDGASETGLIDLALADSILTFDGPFKPSEGFSGQALIGPGSELNLTHPININGNVSMWGAGADSAVLFASQGLTMMPTGSLGLSGGSAIIFGQSTEWQGGSEISIPAGSNLSLQSATSDFEQNALINNSGIVNAFGQVIYRGASVTGSGSYVHHGSVEITDNDQVVNLLGSGAFDLDGTGSEDTTTTVQAGRTLEINADRIEFSAGQNNTFDGVLDNRGHVNVNTTTAWRMNGQLHMDGQNNQTSIGGSSPMFLGPNAEVLCTNNAGSFETALGIEPGAQIAITSPSTLRFNEQSTWDGAIVTGDGSLVLNAPAYIAGDNTVDAFAFVFDNASTVVQNDAVLNINAYKLTAGTPGGDGVDGPLTLQGRLDANVVTGFHLEGPMHFTGGTYAGSTLNMRTIGADLFVHNSPDENVIEAPLHARYPDSVHIDPGAVLRLVGGTIMDVSNSGPSTVNGDGTLIIESDLSVAGLPWINVANLAWNIDGSTTTLSPGANFTIISDTLDGVTPTYHGNLVLGDNTRLAMSNTAGQWTNAGTVTFNGDAGDGNLPRIDGEAFINDGHVSGTGEVAYADFTNNGYFIIGDDGAAGEFRVDYGEFTQNLNGVMKFDIGGYQPGVDHDHFWVGDSSAIIRDAFVAGGLDVSLINGFVPQVGEEFTLITSEHITGTFDEVYAPGFDIDVVYGTTGNPDRVVATFTGVFPCAGDTNGDDLVNVTDLLELLATWGPCPNGQTCFADFDGNGSIDVSDLLVVLANWGSCEV